MGDLSPSGVVQLCGHEDCRARVPDAAPPPVVARVAPAVQVQPIAPGPVAFPPQPAPSFATEAPPPMSAEAIGALARARLTWLEAEIAKRTAYQGEAETLRSLLRAVEPPSPKSIN